MDSPITILTEHREVMDPPSQILQHNVVRQSLLRILRLEDEQIGGLFKKWHSNRSKCVARMIKRSVKDAHDSDDWTDICDAVIRGLPDEFTALFEDIGGVLRDKFGERWSYFTADLVGRFVNEVDDKMHGIEPNEITMEGKMISSAMWPERGASHLTEQEIRKIFHQRKPRNGGDELERAARWLYDLYFGGRRLADIARENHKNRSHRRTFGRYGCDCRSLVPEQA